MQTIDIVLLLIKETLQDLQFVKVTLSFIRAKGQLSGIQKSDRKEEPNMELIRTLSLSGGISSCFQCPTIEIVYIHVQIRLINPGVLYYYIFTGLCVISIESYVGIS